MDSAHGGRWEVECTTACWVHTCDIVTDFVGPTLSRHSWDTIKSTRHRSLRATIHVHVLHLRGFCYLRSSWGFRGQRVGEAANPGPGGSRRTIRCREERRSPYAGQRIGEAANPGPAVNDDQMKMLMSLLQLILQLVTQLASGGGADVRATVAAANQTLQGIAGGSGGAAPPAVREVRFEEEWQQPKRRRGRGGQQGNDGQGAVGPSSPQQAKPVVLQSPGKGQGKASIPEPKGKGKGKGVAPIARPVPPVTGKGGLRADDWIGKLISFEDLSDYSAAGESVVVEARDSSQASIAQAMIRGAGLKSSFLIVYPDPEGKQKALARWCCYHAACHKLPRPLRARRPKRPSRRRPRLLYESLLLGTSARAPSGLRPRRASGPLSRASLGSWMPGALRRKRALVRR